MDKLFKVVNLSQVNVIQNSIEYVMEDNEIKGYNALGLDFLPVIVRRGKACVLDREALIDEAEYQLTRQRPSDKDSQLGLDLSRLQEQALLNYLADKFGKGYTLGSLIEEFEK